MESPQHPQNKNNEQNDENNTDFPLDDFISSPPHENYPEEKDIDELSFLFESPRHPQNEQNEFEQKSSPEVSSAPQIDVEACFRQFKLFLSQRESKALSKMWEAHGVLLSEYILKHEDEKLKILYAVFASVGTGTSPFIKKYVESIEDPVLLKKFFDDIKKGSTGEFVQNKKTILQNRLNRLAELGIETPPVEVLTQKRPAATDIGKKRANKSNKTGTFVPSQETYRGLPGRSEPGVDFLVTPSLSSFGFLALRFANGFSAQEQTPGLQAGLPVPARKPF